MSNKKESNEQLVIRIKAGIDESENMLQLWQQNHGMIYKLIGRYKSMAEEEDLLQESYLALCDAVEHYRQEEEVPFINYAVLWMKQRMIRYGQNNGVVRVPVNSGERARKYKQLVSSFSMQIGRPPTDRELCYHLDVTSEVLDGIKNADRMASIKSLDIPVSEDGEITLCDSVADPWSLEDTVMDKVQAEQLKAIIWPIVEALPGKYPEVIRARFQDGKTLKEVGQQIGITTEGVRQYQAKALRELRKPSRARQIRPYYDEYMTKCYHHVGISSFNRTWTSATEYAAMSGK